MAAPVVAGAAALLLQINPNLTPGMIKMLLQFTAQPLDGYNMFEQGAGQLNLEGAVRAAKYLRNVNFSTYTNGQVMYKTGMTFPTLTSTIGGEMINWSGGITTGHGFIRNNNLLSRYNKVYDSNNWFGSGIEYTNDGTMTVNPNLYYSTTGFYQRVNTSNGTYINGGSQFVASGILIGDGVLMGDGILIGDGVLMSDGILIGDGVLMSDTTMATTEERWLTATKPKQWMPIWNQCSNFFHGRTLIPKGYARNRIALIYFNSI